MKFGYTPGSHESKTSTFPRSDGSKQVHRLVKERPEPSLEKVANMEW